MGAGHVCRAMVVGATPISYGPEIACMQVPHDCMHVVGATLIAYGPESERDQRDVESLVVLWGVAIEGQVVVEVVVGDRGVELDLLAQKAAKIGSDEHWTLAWEGNHTGVRYKYPLSTRYQHSGARIGTTQALPRALSGEYTLTS